MSYKLIWKSILNFLFLKPDGNIDWIKSIRNILLLFIILYYIDFFYLSNDTSRMWMDTGDGGMVVFGYIIICYISAFFILCLRLFKNKIFWLLQIFCLAALFFFYRLVILFCITPFCLLNPLSFIPLVWGIFLFFKGSKYFNLIFTILILIPSTIIITDDIVGRIKISHFYNTCKEETPKAEYNPIYLPKEYFHQENINGNTVWKPNIVECKWGNDENPQKYSKGIYVGLGCFESNYKYTKTYLENDFIVICHKYVFNNDSTNFVLNQVQKDGTLKQIVRTYSLKTTWQYNWLSDNLKRAVYSCSYGLDKLVPIPQASEEKNFQDNELFYDNYIKMLPDTKTTANTEVP